jgi:hypothetical protein
MSAGDAASAEVAKTDDSKRVARVLDIMGA